MRKVLFLTNKTMDEAKPLTLSIYNIIPSALTLFKGFAYNNRPNKSFERIVTWISGFGNLASLIASIVLKIESSKKGSLP
jgi:hypothetical protein